MNLLVFSFYQIIDYFKTFRKKDFNIHHETWLWYSSNVWYMNIKRIRFSWHVLNLFYSSESTETEDEHDVEEEAESITEHLTEEATKDSSISNLPIIGPETGIPFFCIFAYQLLTYTTG